MMITFRHEADRIAVSSAQGSANALCQIVLHGNEKRKHYMSFGVVGFL